MARLTYDFSIGYDRDVTYDQVIAPDLTNYTLDVVRDGDSLSELTSEAEPALHIAGDADTALDIASSDIASRLATDSELSLQVEVDQ